MIPGSALCTANYKPNAWRADSLGLHQAYRRRCKITGVQASRWQLKACSWGIGEFQQQAQRLESPVTHQPHLFMVNMGCNMHRILFREPVCQQRRIPTYTGMLSIRFLSLFLTGHHSAVLKIQDTHAENQRSCSALPGNNTGAPPELADTHNSNASSMHPNASAIRMRMANREL